MFIDHPLFNKAKNILIQLENEGHEAYFVGGCIRDMILGREISDVDIATSAYPQEVQQIFPKHFDVGLEHGTVMVLSNKETYEVTTFRTESGYQDYRRPDKVEFVKDLSEDLLRRDFTMNALAMTKDGEIIDYFAGQEAIKHQEIIAVGIADERFNEDALRMLRAVRFAGQLNFSIESETYDAIAHHAPLLSKIAVERILVEMNKLWESLHWQQGLSAFYQTKLYQYCPLTDSLAKSFEHLLNDFAPSTPFNEATLAWTLVLWFQDESAISPQKFGKAWKMSNANIELINDWLTIIQYREQHNDYSNWKLYQLNGQLVQDFEDFLCEQQDAHSPFGNYFSPAMPDEVTKQYQDLPIHSLKDLAIGGREIIQSFAPKNKRLIGKSLKWLEKEVVCGRIVNKKDLLLSELSKSFNWKG